MINLKYYHYLINYSIEVRVFNGIADIINLEMVALNLLAKR